MKQRLNLNFVDKHPFAPDSISRSGLLLLLAGLLLLGGIAQHYHAKKTEYERRLATLTQKNLLEKTLAQSNLLKKQTLSAISSAPVSTETLKQVNEAVSYLTTPWNTLFSALENNTSPDIALLNIEPSKKKQQLVLTGQAKDMRAALYYVEQLARLPMLSAVYLQKHEVDLEDPFKPVSFVIVAQWS